ncbi:hypothetical protein RUM44_009998 [Polyplax serrata]|uniref:Amino acid transporter transmembrane domain-containing protein n=1 Tax=Polyplax serrata TaxID=468196 RepID=A0ABR1AUB2_POLSC
MSAHTYRITPKDAENGNKYKDYKDWDPFAARQVAEPTTDCETLTHLLKASLGTGILAMPDAFRNSGLTLGIFATIFVAFLCTYCSYILVKCAHELYKRTRVTAMGFAEVAETAFNAGPKPMQRYSSFARFIIQFGLFLTYFGTCSVYTVIIGKNFGQVINYHTGEELDQRWIIGGCLIPLILLGWVPNLKKLAPISMVANIFMGVGLGITFYYLVWDLPSISERPQVGSISDFPAFFSLTIFAMEAIGVGLEETRIVETWRIVIINIFSNEKRVRRGDGVRKIKADLSGSYRVLICMRRIIDDGGSEIDGTEEPPRRSMREKD